MTDIHTAHRSRPRLAAAIVIAAIPLAVLIVASILLAGRLGPRMATHWSTGRYPDDFSSTSASLLTITAIVAALTVVAIVIIVAVRDGRAARTFAAIVVGVAGMLAIAWIASALATIAAPTPERATLGPRLLLLLVAVALALLIVPVIPRGRIANTDAHTVTPLTLDRTERVAWVGQAGSWLFAALGVVVAIGCVIGAAVVLADGGPTDALWGFGVGVLAGLSVLLLARVRLTVDHRGVRLVSALLRIPLMSVPLRKVSAVSVETIDPLSWGGWGYRFVPGRRAYITARREGLVVMSSSGIQTAVTIPGADGAASVLQALIARGRAVPRR